MIKKLSVVATLYKSAKHIDEFHERMVKTISALNIKDYEIILVDDGSPDNSLEQAVKIQSKNSNVHVIELSRNFGHHKAMMTGLSHATGDHVFLIDSDLEEEPELLETFIGEMKDNEDLDVVYGVQKTRKGKAIERIGGQIFYKLFNLLSDNIKIEPNFLTIRLMKKDYVNNLLEYKCQDFYFLPATFLTGFNLKAIEIKKHSFSETTYSFFQRYNLLIKLMLSVSSKPLYAIFYIGIFITFIAAIVATWIFIQTIFSDVQGSGWPSLIVSIWFFGGMNIMFLGVLSIYVHKIFIESKPYPFTVIRKIYESK